MNIENNWKIEFVKRPRVIPGNAARFATRIKPGRASEMRQLKWLKGIVKHRDFSQTWCGGFKFLRRRVRGVCQKRGLSARFYVDQTVVDKDVSPSGFNKQRPVAKKDYVAGVRGGVLACGTVGRPR